VNVELALALQALWKGLLYDADARDEAFRLAPRLPHTDAIELRARVARDGLAAKHAGVRVLALAKETVALACAGLARHAPEEVAYLEVLRAQVCAEEACPADVLLRNWHGAWHGSARQLIEHLRVA
jgi:glutamate--cysteine ligase